MKSSSITARVAKNIALARKQAGLRQSDVAEALGVTTKAVSNWELGEMDCSYAKLEKMAELFNLGGRWLWFYQDHDQESEVDPELEQLRQEAAMLRKICQTLGLSEVPRSGRAVTIHYALARLAERRPDLVQQALEKNGVSRQAELLVESIRKRRESA